MSNDDSDASEAPYIFECVDCGERVEAESSPGDCPACGGEMQNISTSRE